MLLQFSDSKLDQFRGVFYYNRVNILIFLTMSTAVTCVYELAEVEEIAVHILPVSLMGGALAIFLAFRNNSAYDRWWEARKVWGGIVNYSRTWSMLVHSIIVNESDRKELVRRHLAWMYAVNIQLRKKEDFTPVWNYLSAEESKVLSAQSNKATQIVVNQGQRIETLKDSGALNDFQAIKMYEVQEELYNLQGKAERIKGTVFPYYYSYFTRLFLWIFLILLPFSLVGELGWATIPIVTAVSFVFAILEKTGTVTEDPFENRSADVPLDTICRIIEIDLLETLREKDIPERPPVEKTKFNVSFVR